MMDMIEIDGTYGEGGGQVLRTSLSLAALTGRGVHFTGIRGGRRKPGLMRQHLACVKAVAEITSGTLEGAELNAQELTFKPGKIRAGNYHFVVGSAGSTILVAQTVIPVLLMADAPSHVTIEGGTHADGAPIYEFFEQVYLAALRKMGAEVAVKLDGIGFYPAGGGKILLEIQPVREWKPFSVLTRGKLLNSTLTALGSEIPTQILEDEIRICREDLQGQLQFRTRVREVESVGPGNVLLAILDFEEITEIFSICGDYGVTRKKVADRVAGMLQKYLKSSAPVGRFLADQLLLPMAIGAGGAFKTLAPTLHTTTNIEMIRKFLDVRIGLENLNDGTYIIDVTT